MFVLGFGLGTPLAGADDVTADADVDLTTTCDGVGCQFDAHGDHSGDVIVTGQLTVEGPGLPSDGLEATCEGSTECDTDLEGTAGVGCFLATATTETAAGGFAQDQTQSGDCQDIEQ